MKTNIEDLGKQKKSIRFELSWAEFRKYIEKAAEELGKELRLKGFRPGKIPVSVVEKEVPKERLLSLAADIAIKSEYLKFIKEKGIEAIGSPRAEILKMASGNPFEFKIEVEVLPEIQLPDYKKIAAEVKKKEVVVKDEEVEQTLKWIQNSRAKFSEVERGAKEGDFVEIEYKSAQVEGGKIQKDSFFLGKGQFVPGFEENLYGMKKGEKKEFSVKFPEGFSQKNLAGKDVIFEVEMKKVQEAELPRLDDAFAKSVGRFETLEDLRKSVREGIFQEKEVEEKKRRRQEILDKIVEALDFEVPQTLIMVEQERMLQNIRDGVRERLGISFEDYLTKIKKTEEELRQSLKKEAERSVKNFLVLRELGKKEKIEVKDEEIEQIINEQVLKGYASIEQAQKEIDIERIKEYYRGALYNEKVLERLENFSH